jgi:hypothetical protein
MEERAKSLLFGVIRDGDSITFQPDDLCLLAAFAFKCAVVADYSHMHSNPFFSPRARSEFGLNLSVPPEVRVWLAAFQGAHSYSGRFDSQIIQPTPDGLLRGVEFSAFTYVAGHLALQVLAPRWTNPLWRTRLLPYTLKPDAYWDTAVTRFWPADGSVISWPPPQYIGDDVVETFTNRFAVPIQVPIAI